VSHKLLNSRSSLTYMRDVRATVSREILMVKGCRQRMVILYCSAAYRFEVYGAALDAAVVCFVADNSNYSQRSAEICSYLPSNSVFRSR
jgi:hypothetical protein